jgi:hypothetical protein
MLDRGVQIEIFVMMSMGKKLMKWMDLRKSLEIEIVCLWGGLGLG